jgi:hypothetical protein
MAVPHASCAGAEESEGQVKAKMRKIKPMPKQKADRAWEDKKKRDQPKTGPTATQRSHVRTRPIPSPSKPKPKPSRPKTVTAKMPKSKPPTKVKPAKMPTTKHKHPLQKWT